MATPSNTENVITSGACDPNTGVRILYVVPDHEAVLYVMAEDYFGTTLSSITPSRAQREKQRSFLDEISCVIKRALTKPLPASTFGRGRGRRGRMTRPPHGQLHAIEQAEQQQPLPQTLLFGSAATDMDLSVEGYSDLDIAVNFALPEGSPASQDDLSAMVCHVTKACPYDRHSLIERIVKVSIDVVGLLRCLPFQEFEGDSFTSLRATTACATCTSIESPFAASKPTRFTVTKALSDARVPLISVRHDTLKASRPCCRIAGWSLHYKMKSSSICVSSLLLVRLGGRADCC